MVTFHDRIVLLHPKRQPDSLRVFSATDRKVLMLVDGLHLTDITENDELSAFICESDIQNISAHATHGVFEGEVFDNRKDPDHLLTVDQITLLTGLGPGFPLVESHTKNRKQ